MDTLHSLLLFMGSLISNTLASMSGGGAGLLQFPLLLFLGLPFATALATHKVASVALGLGSSFKQIRSGHINWGFNLYVSLTGMLGVIFGANIIVFIPTRYAEIALACLILGLGIYSRFKPSFGQEEKPTHRTLSGYATGTIIITSIAILNGSLTAGSGLFVTLFLVQWFGFNYKQAVAITLISVGLIWNGVGAIAVYQAGADIYWSWLPILLIGSLLGGYLGAHLAQQNSNQLIKRLFETLTLLIGVKLLIGPQLLIGLG